ADRVVQVLPQAGRRQPVGREAHRHATQHLPPIPHAAAATRLELLAQIARDDLAFAAGHQTPQQTLRHRRGMLRQGAPPSTSARTYPWHAPTPRRPPAAGGNTAATAPRARPWDRRTRNSNIPWPPTGRAWNTGPLR